MLIIHNFKSFEYFFNFKHSSSTQNEKNLDGINHSINIKSSHGKYLFAKRCVPIFEDEESWLERKSKVKFRKKSAINFIRTMNHEKM